MTRDYRQEMIDGLKAGRDIRSSDRERDKARQKLRRQGFIEYTGTPRRWAFTEKGRNAFVVEAE